MISQNNVFVMDSAQPDEKCRSCEIVSQM